MAGEDWRRLADYVVARRVELRMKDRRAFAEATGVTERTLGKLENGQRVSPSTLGVVENHLGWAPGSCRRILAGGEPNARPADHSHDEYEDPTLRHIASTPGLTPTARGAAVPRVPRVAPASPRTKAPRARTSG